MGKIKFEKDNILPKKMIIAVWDSKSNWAVYTIWLDPGAIIGVGDRKSGVHVACENIRFSSLFVAGDVPSDEERGETDVFAG